MLRKVLKHDLNAIWRPWLIISASVLAISVVAGIALRALITLQNTWEHFAYWAPFAMMVIMIALVGVAAYCIFSTVFIMVKYYQSFFTDVGYLTFTLPVKRSTLFNSKILTGFIFSFGSIVNTVLAVIIALAIAPANKDGSGMLLANAWQTFVSAFTDLVGLPIGWFSGILVTLIIVGLLYFVVFSNLLIYMCVTVGCTLVKKLKVLASIGIYYAANSIMSIISYTLSWIWGVVSECMVVVAPNELTIDSYMTAMLLALIIAAMAIIVLSVLLYRFTLSRIEKNLNLA